VLTSPGVLQEVGHPWPRTVWKSAFPSPRSAVSSATAIRRRRCGTMHT